MEQLDNKLDSEGLKGFLMRDDSSNSDMYYLTGFEASDPYIFLRTNSKSIIVVPQLEYSRAKEEAEVDEILSTAEFGEGEARDNREKQLEIMKGLLDRNNVDRVGVPEEFSLGFARDLKSDEIELKPLQGVIMDIRKEKTDAELKKIEKAQRFTEEAMKRAKKTLKESEFEDGNIIYEEEQLTSERLREEIKQFLRSRNCTTPEGTIVASGEESADSHAMGSGKIEPGKPLIIDIFPRTDSKYFGDMTRTFVKGERSEEVKKMEKAVKEAQKKALQVLEEGAGVKASQIHNEVCDVLEEHGYDTIRQKEGTEEGLVHSTGHAIGLDLHEPPRLADNEDELKEGYVLTVEPGLYLKDVGGLRIEDMVVVEEDGYRNLNSMEYRVEID